MKQKIIMRLTVDFACYGSEKTGLSPDYSYKGNAIKIIEGDSTQECIERVQKFCRDSGFSILKEVPSGIRGNNPTGNTK